MEKQKIDLKKYNGNLVNKTEAKIGVITLIYNLKKKSMYLVKITGKTKNEITFNVLDAIQKTSVNDENSFKKFLREIKQYCKVFQNYEEILDYTMQINLKKASYEALEMERNTEEILQSKKQNSYQNYL